MIPSDLFKYSLTKNLFYLQNLNVNFRIFLAIVNK